MRLDHMAMRHTVHCWQPIRHPAYNTFDVRLGSYFSCPKHGEAPTPTALSELGSFMTVRNATTFNTSFLFQFHFTYTQFFITGQFDETTCFHCGVGLCDWCLTDDAWVEHVRWSPFCLYVYVIKGSSFVRRGILRGVPFISFSVCRSQSTH